MGVAYVLRWYMISVHVEMCASILSLGLSVQAPLWCPSSIGTRDIDVEASSRPLLQGVGVSKEEKGGKARTFSRHRVGRGLL